MATKKSKSSKKSDKATSTPKSAAKTVEKTELEAPKKPVEKAEKAEKVETVKKEKSCFAGFFAKKYEEKESILTIFKSHKFYGALLGEVLGMLLITVLLLSISLMGIASIATYAFAVVAIYIVVYAFSGACLNPIAVVGMMATRRMSVIRGVTYIIAEIAGAWLGWLIMNAFHLAGGDTAYALTTMSAIAEGSFWKVAMVELFGAAIFAFCYARALNYKRSIFTFAAIITGGLLIAIVAGYVVSAAFLGLSNNFIFNPAVALMMQIFPTAGESFGEILGGICQALSAYAIIPMIGGVIGFYLSDFAAKLSGENE